MSLIPLSKIANKNGNETVQMEIADADRNKFYDMFDKIQIITNRSFLSASKMNNGNMLEEKGGTGANDKKQLGSGHGSRPSII
jgi:hypothetical protein